MVTASFSRFQQPMGGKKSGHLKAQAQKELSLKGLCIKIHTEISSLKTELQYAFREILGSILLVARFDLVSTS